jgi:phenylacetate-CoA ligase
VTHLGNFAFPLIRYDTGDIGSLAAERPLGAFPVMDRIEGRSAERLVLGQKTLFPASVGQQLIRSPELVDAIRLYQCAQIGDDAIELRVVWSTMPQESWRAEIESLLRPAVNPTTTITIENVERLETLSSGKRWVLRDFRQARDA